MKAANMRAQLVAQIAGRLAAADTQRLGYFDAARVVQDADDLVSQVETTLGEPIYKDRSWESQEQS